MTPSDRGLDAGLGAGEGKGEKVNSQSEPIRGVEQRLFLDGRRESWTGGAMEPRHSSAAGVVGLAKRVSRRARAVRRITLRFVRTGSAVGAVLEVKLVEETVDDGREK